MITLVVTIIVMIILAGLVFTRNSNLPTEASYAKLVQEMTNVQSGVYNKRVHNAQSGDDEKSINSGFAKVVLTNAPSTFQSFDSEYGKVTGYLVGLDVIEYDNASYGTKYTKILGDTTVVDADKNYEVEFNKDDVYVYDATGEIYYAKGMTYDNERVYSLTDASQNTIKSTEDGPIISNIIVASGEIENAAGEKILTTSKAKVIVNATPRTSGNSLTVMVRSTEATKQSDGTYMAQVSRNGTYTVVVTEENGGRTVAKVNVTGIIENIDPPANLSMKINDGATSTQSPLVTITLHADGASQMIIAKNEPVKPRISDSRWDDYKETIEEYNLGTIEGKVTLYAWFKDDYSNVTETIVKASILYDKTAPKNTAPTLTTSGPYIIVTSNQTDNVSSKEYLLAHTEYGYREYSLYEGDNEDAYTWGTSKLISGLENKKNYQVITRVTDEAGNTSVSNYATTQISYDYEIAFDLKGGSGDFASTYASVGDEVILPSKYPNKLGYNFLGWTLDSDTSDIESLEIMNPGDVYIPKDADSKNLKITLYAVWKARTDVAYTINSYFEDASNLGYYNLTPSGETRYDGETGKDVIVGGEEIEGFILNETMSKPLSQTIDGSGTTTFNLYYNRVRYSLVVNAQNGVAYSSKTNVAYEEIIQLESYANLGYEFECWEVKEKASGNILNLEENFIDGITSTSTRFKMPTSNLIITAKYTPKKYKITYNLKNGILATTNPSVYTAETESFTLTNPTKNGYTFTGWTGTNLNTASTEVTINPKTMLELKDLEYTATYTPNEDLLTMQVTPETYTSDPVRVTVKCLDSALTLEYKIGENGSWQKYLSPITIETNTTVYARASENGIIIDTEEITINNIDKEFPVIQNVTVSDEWISGTTLRVKVNATDNMHVYGFTVTSTNSEPEVENYTEITSDVQIKTTGLNYLWVRDDAGNVSKEIIYAWDISAESDKEVYAAIFKNKRLEIAGDGETASYSNSDDVPYVDYKYAIEEVEIKSGITKINDNVLTNLTKASTIYIPKTLTAISDDAIYGTSEFSEIQIDDSNKNFSYDNYTLFDKSKTKIYIHSNKDTNATYTIPGTVETIGKRAFYNNDNIRKIIATGNSSVMESAFENCSTLVQIEGTIGGESVGARAFAECQNLISIKLSNITELGARAFYNATKLSEIEIPKTVTTIKDQAGVKEIFKNIGIYSENSTGKGIVKYYQSCTVMNEYARTYPNEATFVMIDDKPASLVKLAIEEPVSGTYPWGTKVTIVAEFDETLSTEKNTTLPELKLKVGDSTASTVTNAKLQDNKIIYVYEIPVDTEGKVTLVSYSGKVYDIPGNETTITADTLTGEDIVVNTFVKLIEDGKTTYYTKLQNAINNAKENPENVSKIILLKDITESVIVLANRNIELDLNTKTLTGEKDIETIINNAKLSIINNGKIISNNQIAVATNPNAETTITNVTIQGTSTTKSAIKIAENANVTLVNTNVSGSAGIIDNSGYLVLNKSTITASANYAIQTGDSSVTNIKSSTITNSVAVSGNPAIYVSTGSTVYVENSNITSDAVTAIENNNVLEISGTSIVSSTNSIAIENKNSLLIYNGTIENESLAKETINNVGTFTMQNGKINSQSNTALVNNGTARILGGTVESTSESNNTIENKSSGTITINKAQVVSENETVINNNGKVTLENNAKVNSKNKVAVINNQASTFIITSGDVTNSATEGAVIENSGTITTQSANIIGYGEYGINNLSLGELNIKDINIKVESKTKKVVGLYLQNKKKVQIENITVNAKSESNEAVGIKQLVNELSITSGDINGTSVSSSGYGIYSDGGITIVGTNDATTGHSNPKIEGTTYGYYSTNGSLDFFDGCFTGEISKSIVGTIRNMPTYGFVRITKTATRETATIETDNVKPSNVTLTASSYGWTNKEVTLSGDASDDNSGIAAYAFTSSSATPESNEWTAVDGAPLTITKVIKSSECRKYYFHVKDKAGNEAVSNEVEVKFDNVAPQITSITKDPDGWSASDIEVTITATDNLSGINGYQYTKTEHELDQELNNYTAVSPTKSFTGTLISDNAKWYIYIKDQAGNVTSGDVTIDKVDKVIPTISVETSTSGDGFSTLKITATDDACGISEIAVNGTELELKGDESSLTRTAYYKVESATTLNIVVKDKVENKAELDVSTYQMVYHANGGSGADIYRFKLQNEDTAYIENEFTKAGYKFNAWQVGRNESGDAILKNPGELYTSNLSCDIYATWIDITPPEILDIVKSENWNPDAKEDLKVKVAAEDNDGSTLYYAITQNAEKPARSSMQTSNEFAIASEGKYYAWVEDTSANFTSGEIVIYNVSKNASDKNAYAILKDNTESNSGKTMQFVGSGDTANYSDETTTKWYSIKDSITRVEIKESIKSLGNKILSNLTNMDKLVIENTLETIAIDAMIHTNNYSNIYVEDGNFSYKNGMLTGEITGMVYSASTKSTPKQIALPSSIMGIAPYAFENTKVESVSVATNFDLLEGAFKNASKLQNIYAAKGMGGDTIEDSAFEGCVKLEYVEISNRLETIGEKVFKDCENLTDIVMPGTVNEMPTSGVFENIGISAGTGSGKGYVYYYESSTEMTAYATADTTKDEATFVAIDDIKPVVESVIINSGDSVASTLEVKVFVKATDNHEVTGIYISNNLVELDGSEDEWQAYTEGEYDFVLPEQNGIRTVYVYAKDAKDNISTPLSDTIMLAKHEFKLNGESVINQYKDETGLDYYEYREQGATIVEDDFTIQISDNVDHETVGQYLVDYDVSYSGEYVKTYHRTVNILENDWNTAEYEKDKFIYVFHKTGKYAKVVGYRNNNVETTLEIPSTVDAYGETYTVIDIGDGTTGIARNGSSETKIVSLVIPKTVIAISDYAFGNFTNISSIQYEKSLMSIGKYAFTNWATYKAEDESTYKDTSSTATISSLTIKENVREVKQNAFDRVTINSLTIEEGVKAIYENAFRGDARTNTAFALTIPKSIDKLGDGTSSPFTYMELASINVAEGNAKYKSENDGKELLTIDGKTFMQYASAISDTTYSVDATVETIGKAAFAGATNLSTVTLTNNITNILDSAFKNSGLTNIEIPTSTSKIYESTYEGTKLQKVYIRSNITEVDNRAFAKINDLEMIVFEGTPTIKKAVFASDSSLSSVVMLAESGVTSISEVTTLPENTIIYVPSASQETAYESATTWSSLGADRIRHIITLVGTNPVSMGYGETYIEEGITVLGESMPSGSGDSSIISRLTITREDNIDSDTTGEYFVKYKLIYSGDEIGYLNRTVKVVDEIPPVISGVKTSSSWVPGNALKLEVIAEDDYEGTNLTYAITSVIGTQDATWSSDKNVSVVGEENYVHARDKSLNVASLNVKAWDISKTFRGKTAYAYLTSSGELIITGTGETATFVEGDTPWLKTGITITKVTIEEGITKLGENVLSSLENVKQINLPISLTDAANTAFAKTNNFDKIVVASGDGKTAGMKVVDDILMNNAGTTLYMRGRKASGDTYTMPETVTRVASYAFYNNTVSQLTVWKGVSEIGTKVFAGTTGKVRYYTSSDAMRGYVATYPDEADFEMIDDVAPNTQAPTLKASSSVIVATSNQTDRDSAIETLVYNIRKSGDAYDDSKWQSRNYFTGLLASTTYFVKTKATDTFGNSAESLEASIETKAVPDQIKLTASPVVPTSGDVTVTVEWPQELINLMYGGLSWPEGTDAIKQIGTMGSGETSITWSDANNQDATSSTVNVHDNYTTVYARLYDGTNYTAQTRSITITVIDRIGPTGTVTINSGDALTYSGEKATLDNVVNLYLDAEDDRKDPGFGVSYYLVKENDETTPAGNLASENWIAYEGAKNYSFEMTATRGTKTINVWFMDTAGNVGTKASDKVYMLPNVAKLSESGKADEYFDSLSAAITAAQANASEASNITLLKDLKGMLSENGITIPGTKKLIIDMNGHIAETTGTYFIENHGNLKIKNTEGGTTYIKITGANAIGINNFGILEVQGVTIEAATAVLNQRT